MRNCIFTAHCLEPMCDKSCPAYVETSYLLERNNLLECDSVYSADEKLTQYMCDVLDDSQGSLTTLVVPSGNSLDYADILTYCAVCKNWKGSQLHLNVYNLRYSSYMEAVKKSWSGPSNSENLEYVDIWAKSCKVLIVSGFDYVNFGDFESQTLLNLIQSRREARQTTILVSPRLGNLVSTKSSVFFRSLKSLLSESARVVDKL